VNSGKRRLLALADSDPVRLAVVVAFAAVLCPLLLVRMAGGFAVRESAPPARPELEMRLVEIAPPTLAPSAAPAVHEAVTQPSARAEAKRATHATAQPQVPHHAEPVHDHASPPPTAREDAVAADARPPAPATPTASPAPTAPSNTVAATTGGASGSTPARVLSQPMPVLPDDLREQGYQMTAVAHFRIHADGSFEVDLVKPTQNPRLNQILLETLHRWRFFPAMENGHPVDCDQDVRVHFVVS
jgi:periplasmic protein TonB